jgi:predicted transcriptional regulator
MEWVKMINNLEIKLLSALFQAKEPVSTADVARVVGCPRTTASDYLIAFARSNVIVDVGGKNNLHRWVMTEEWRQVIQDAIDKDFQETLDELVEKGEINTEIVAGKQVYFSKSRTVKPCVVGCSSYDYPTAVLPELRWKLLSSINHYL